jgi:hypothetical protein
MLRGFAFCQSLKNPLAQMAREVDYAYGSPPSKIFVRNHLGASMRRVFLAACSLLLCPLLVAQQVPTTPASSQQPAAQPSTPASTATPSQPQASQPATPASAAAPSQPPPPNTLLDGTPVKLRLSETISSADAKVGQEVPFEVVEDVEVNGVVVLPKGATAIGTVTEAEPKRHMGRGGKLNVNISYARLADQEKAALRATHDTQGGGHVGAMTGAMVATAIVFFPAAPLFLFMKGKDITIPQGTEISAFVDGDMHLDMARFGAAPPAPMGVAPAAQVQASLAVDSNPPGADIEVDGTFVGNTPSTINVTPGNHDVSVKKKGYVDWDRKLNVSGGSIHLSADLEATTQPTTQQSAPQPAAQQSAPQPTAPGPQ